MSTLNPPPRRLPVGAAAAYVGLAVSTMNKARCAGGGALFYKLGGRVVYDVTDLDAWMASHRRASTSALAAA